jgi:uridine nucleosidase
MALPTRTSESDMTTLASTLRPMLHELVMFFASTYAHVYGLTSGPPLHDPIAVVAILSDQPFDRLGFDDGDGERWHVRVITDGLHSHSSDQRGQVGRTVATVAPLHKGGVRIPRSLNVECFWETVEDCIRRAEKVLSRSSGTV